jgi:hypothetical protein
VCRGAELLTCLTCRTPCALPFSQITEEVRGVLTTVNNGAADLMSHAQSTLGSMVGANPSVPTFSFS